MIWAAYLQLLSSTGYSSLNWITVKLFPLDQDLSALSNYLHQRGLQHRITEENGQQCLAVLDEAVIPALQDFLNQYAQGQVELQPAVVSPQVLHAGPGLFEQAKMAPVVISLIILSGLGALAVGHPIASHFYFAGFGDASVGGEIWRLLTPAFLHFGIFHVLFNSLWMWDLGRRLEFLMGHWHFLLFFAVTAIAANIAQYWWGGSVNFGGMSGVVYALVGFIAVRQRLVPHPLVAVPSALIGFMLVWLVLCMTGVVDYFISGSVANAAHVGGLIAGVVYALLTKNLYQR
ncbi:MAG: rhomboid family intramembrane serine protease [Cellvibrio sp.]|uniref:rhomboid family intramembrane serine protease n=1 Tax=Cellvibrio sp. TaxID=1965322 RepID=UPI0031AAC4E1